MEDLVLEFVKAHPVAAVVIAILFALKIPAALIVNLTSTPVDNVWLKRAYTVIEWLNWIVTAKAKEK